MEEFISSPCTEEFAINPYTEMLAHSPHTEEFATSSYTEEFAIWETPALAQAITAAMDSCSARPAVIVLGIVLRDTCLGLSDCVLYCRINN